MKRPFLPSIFLKGCVCCMLLAWTFSEVQSQGTTPAAHATPEEVGNDESWKLMILVGLAKEVQAHEFKKIRWVALSAVLQKWYLKCLVILLDEDVREASASTIGFAEGRSASEIHGAMNEMMSKAEDWNLSVAMTNGDVQFAFDSMKHSSIEEALAWSGARPGLIAAILRSRTI